MTTQDAPRAGATRGRRRRKWLTIIATIVALVLVFAYAGVSFAMYDQFTYVKGGCWPEAAANTPDAFTADAKWGAGLTAPYQMPKPQDVVFHSRDAAIADTNLAAWWIPASATSAASAPAVVVVHGIYSCRREASVLMAAGMLHKNRFSVLIMDMRNHGDSGFDADHRVAAGADEYLDVQGGWDWVRAQGVPADRIGIMGFSFASGVTVIAGGEEASVPAVWADSSYTETGRAMGLFGEDQLRGHSPIAPLVPSLIPGVVQWGRLNGIDFLRFDPIKEVAKYSGRSLAFVHGTNDTALPAEMATTMHDAAIAAGATSPDPWVVPGAGHTEAIYVDPTGYESRLVAFFDRALKRTAS